MPDDAIEPPFNSVEHPNVSARNFQHGWTDENGVRWLGGAFREGCPLCDPEARKTRDR